MAAQQYMSLACSHADRTPDVDELTTVIEDFTTISIRLPSGPEVQRLRGHPGHRASCWVGNVATCRFASSRMRRTRPGRPFRLVH